MLLIDSICDIASFGLDDSEMQQVGERLALAYLTGTCRAAELHQTGASDALTVWLHSQVKRDRNRWVHRRTGCVGVYVDYDVDYNLSLECMTKAAKSGVLEVTKTSSTGGTPLWSETTNDIFRLVHDVHGHVGYGLGFSTQEECHLALLTCGDFLDFVNSDPTWGGHWDHATITQAKDALLSEIGLQAVAVWWLGGFDKVRPCPYTGQMLKYSQKVVL